MRRILHGRADASAGPSAQADGGARVTPRRRATRKHPDLSTRLLPLIPAGQWKSDPDTALSTLYEDAQSRATEVCDWYMADRLGRRRPSQLLRFAALVLASAGGIIPLVNVAAGQDASGWGYLLLAAAGVCYGIDHFLGLSAGWMRDMTTVQRVRRRLQEFQFAWMQINAADARKDPAETSVDAYLKLVHDFDCDLEDLVISETADWVSEFQSGLQQLDAATSKK